MFNDRLRRLSGWRCVGVWFHLISRWVWISPFRLNHQKLGKERRSGPVALRDFGETKVMLLDICRGLLSSTNRALDSYYAEVLHKSHKALEDRQRLRHLRGSGFQDCHRASPCLRSVPIASMLVVSCFLFLFECLQHKF